MCLTFILYGEGSVRRTERNPGKSNIFKICVCRPQSMLLFFFFNNLMIIIVKFRYHFLCWYVIKIVLAGGFWQKNGKFSLCYVIVYHLKKFRIAFGRQAYLFNFFFFWISFCWRQCRMYIVLSKMMIRIITWCYPLIFT